jgi:Stage II sporulation protein E (SpoIIE)
VEHELKGLAFRPLTSVNWPDLERLFGKRGACGGCWCMYWRLTQSQFRKQKDEGNRRALRSIVATGEVPGLLAYADGEAANVLLSPGDVLLLYTDGLTEATNSSGEEFGPARLADYVQARPDLRLC